MMNSTVFEGMILEGTKRYYSVDLSVRDYSFENTVPYKLTLGTTVIEQHSWGGMLVALVNYAMTVSPKTHDELFAFECDWSSAALFRTDKKGAATKALDSGLYINCNHNAIHSCWIIGLLVEFFGFAPESVSLLIHRAPSAEPKEVREFYEEKNRSGFRNYLIDTCGMDDKRASEVFGIVEMLGIHLPKISTGYSNIFLFDDYAYAYNYVKKLLDYVFERITLKTEGREEIKSAADKLLAYYKLLEKAAKAN